MAARGVGRAGDPKNVTERISLTPEATNAAGGEQDGQQGAAELTREQLEARVERENAHLSTLNQGLKFRVHEGSGQLLVQVVDRNTGDVLRENPPHEFLDLAVRMREMVGAFLDETS